MERDHQKNTKFIYFLEFIPSLLQDPKIRHNICKVLFSPFSTLMEKIAFGKQTANDFNLPDQQTQSLFSLLTLIVKKSELKWSNINICYFLSMNKTKDMMNEFSLIVGRKFFGK